MPDTVAVTGATGFIGRRLVASLSRAGVSVRALHRARSGRRAPETLPHVHWVQGALEEPAALEDLLWGAQAVVHCAGAVRGATEVDFTGVNVEGVRSVVSACERSSWSPRLLHLSSLAAQAPHLSPYAASKRAGEAVVQSSSGLRWTIFRPPAVYGPGDRELAGLFRSMSWGLGPYPGSLDARVSMMHVDDLVDAIAAWLGNAEAPGGLFELDDGRSGGYTWREILDIMEQITGRRMLRIRLPKAVMMGLGHVNLGLARLTGAAPMLTPGKVRELYRPAWVAEGGASEEALRWRPQRSLERGLRELLETSR